MHELPDSDPTDELLAELERFGRTLVAALQDQFADGQVEALYSLQSAATTVRKHTAALTDATEAQTSAVLDHVSAGFEQLLQEVLATIGERVATEVDQSTVSMVASAKQVALALISTEDAINTITADTTQRAADAQEALEWAASEGARHLSGAADTLGQQSTATETALTSAGTTLTDRVEAVTKSAESRIAAAAEQALAALKAGAAETKAELAAARAEADADLERHVRALNTQLAAQTKRDVALTDRLQDQVEALIARTDQTAGESLRLLQAALTQLDARDDLLEQRRAEAFARVLDDVLTQGGGSNRKLRDRIRRGLDAQPPLPVAVPAAVPEPVAEPVAEVAPAVPPKPTRKAAATKTPAKRTPAAKAPVRAPAQVTAKATTRAPAKAPAKKTPRTTPPKSPSKSPEASA